MHFMRAETLQSTEMTTNEWRVIVLPQIGVHTIPLPEHQSSCAILAVVSADNGRMFGKLQ